MKALLRICAGVVVGAVYAAVFLLGLLLCKGLAGSFIYSGF